MDPLAHTLVGAALAETGLKHRSRYATATLLIGTNLPDIDVVSMIVSGDAALYFRRGWTHGVLAMIVLPLLLAAAIFLWHRWRGNSRGPPETPIFRPAVIVLLAFMAVWSHPALDWLNTYGVRLLMPFDGSWFYGDTLFIIDPWLWLLAAAGIVLANSRSRQALLGWVSLLAISSGLVLGTDFVSPVVKLGWLLGIGVIALLRLRSDRERMAALAVRAGLTLILLYIGAAYTLARVAESALQARYPQSTSVHSNPIPGNPLQHRLMVVQPDTYQIVSATGEMQLLRRQPENAVIQQALSSPEIRGFSNWMRFPYWETEQSEDAWVVNIWDLRYQAPGQSGVSGIGFVSVVVPRDENQSPQ